jgi:hypothetical protein
MDTRSWWIVAAALCGATACANEDEAPLARQTAALDEELGGPDPGDFEPAPAPPAPPSTPAEKLEAAKKAFGFTSSDPSTWSDAKRLEVCEMWASSVRVRYGSNMAYAPALQACLTGKDQELGMMAYQTLEMRQRGFAPSDPHTWSDEKRAEVCDYPADLVYAATLTVYTGAEASKYMKATAAWCESFGAFGRWTFEDEPPTGWDYANWEFQWWKKKYPFSWGTPADDQTPIEDPK